MSKESFWFLEPAQLDHSMFLSYNFHMEGLFLEVHAISLKAELLKVFQERFFNCYLYFNLLLVLFIYLFFNFVVLVFISMSLFLLQVIRALISKGVGSASYTGSFLSTSCL